MTRRLWLAIVGTILATLLVSGIGTLLLARAEGRSDQREELAEQAQAVADIVASVPLRAPQVPLARERLDRLRRSLDLNGIGMIVTDGAGGIALAELPDGVSVEDIDPGAVSPGRPEVTTSGDLTVAVAAAPSGRSRLLVVLTDDQGAGVGRAGRWFLLSAAATLAVGMVVAVRLGRAVSRPVAEALDVTQRIAAGDLAARLPSGVTQRRDELGDLARSIDAMAEGLERSRGLERQFLMSVSHDLRTPMTSIRGYAEALADGAIDDPQQAGRVVLGEATRLERLMADLLMLARLDARAFPLHIGTTDVAGALEAAAVASAIEAAERGVEVQVDPVPPGLTVEADPHRLSQVIANLVENGLRYARTRLVLRAVAVDGWAHLSVRDDGPGIAPHDLEHVFERLYVARRRPEEKESGSGLGLAIVKELTEAMGGAVTARSEPGRGAELVVTLPRP